MTEDPDATAGRQVRLPRPALPAEDHPAVSGGGPKAGISLGAGIDLAEITRLTLDASVPGFAGGASVFALEHLLKEGEPAGPPAAGQGIQVVARRLGTKFARPGRRMPGGAFPPGEVIAFAADSPLARCVSSGRAVRFSEVDRQVMERLGPVDREVLAGYTAFLAVPMTARDTVTGILVLVRAPGVPAFSERDAAAATRLGAQAGTGILNALALIRQRSIADALQRGLLAAEPAVPPGLEIAGRCLPAAGHVIGGDWYDVIPLPGNRTGLVVGDVMGHGPEAAAVMAQLRTTAHALADLDLAPADLLQRLNRVTMTLQRITLATCAYAIIDADSHTCTLAGAGHLPPILALPDGTTRVPELPAGQSLGIGPASYGQARIKLPPGAILTLYTDGLVESRTRSFDQGILALRSVLARQHGNLEAIGEALIASLAGRCEDDITVILARIPADGSG
ncbi:MAG TPA: GAF domain-containing SpoIIE family protein phosphatase [Streptosporangiaceae bacterium]|nr:GAF domain-containing SpoIIE family protein phosphatase [Streptosporangiaceae bacterium]